MAKVIVGKGNRQWEIEFPCEMNGHMTEHTGFVAPIGNNPENSGFFTYYGETYQEPDGQTHPRNQVIGFAGGYFPKYVREAALKLARRHDVG